MSELTADLALRLDAFWPVNQKWIAHTTTIGFPLPAAERFVAGESPTPRVVIEILGTTKIINRLYVVFQRLRYVVEELVLVHGARGTALGAGAIVRNHHDQGVIQLADSLEVVDDAADVMVGVLNKACKHLHHA